MRAFHLGVPPSVPRRVLDLLITGTAFVLLLPLLVLLALLVMMTSPGPVIFRQERIGQGGSPFTLLKFRTMRAGTSGPKVTTSDDGRLTPIGKLLRLAGLDELPFFFNDTATTEIYTLSLHDALPACPTTRATAASNGSCAISAWRTRC